MTPDLKRRSILKTVGAMGLLLAGKQTHPDTLPHNGILQRPIHSSGERLPVIGLGTYQSFGVGNVAADREPLKQVLELFVEHGGSVIDSSPMYGTSEQVIGDLSNALELRPSLFMATKVWTSGQDAGIAQMNESFQRMRVKVMDLMQIHNLMDWRTHAKTLAKWKEAGTIRYTGVTHYHSGAFARLEDIIKTKAFDFVQFNYSIAEREAERRLLPLALDSGTSVIVNRPFAAAGLFSRVRGKKLPSWAVEFDCVSWAQFFLKYIISHPAVTCAIPATSKPEHLVDNMGAGSGKLPDKAMRRRMVSLVEAL